jgi:hypothetical protein
MGVREYRDSSLRIDRLVKKSVGKAEWENDTEGNFESSQKVVVSKQLVRDDPFALTGGEDS